MPTITIPSSKFGIATATKPGMASSSLRANIPSINLNNQQETGIRRRPLLEDQSKHY